MRAKFVDIKNDGLELEFFLRAKRATFIEVIDISISQ